jgi:5-oxoprolinase (ATP-hydrolysing) subunit C
MTIKLIEPGLMTLVQGVPFRGMRHLGMPLAGAADPVSLALANWIVGNAAEAAALETAFAAMSLRAQTACIVAVQGAATGVEINGRQYATCDPLSLAPGDLLRIAAPTAGCRSYVAIRGGIRVTPVLTATSTYVPARLGGLGGIALAKGQIIESDGTHGGEPRTLPERYRLRHGMDFLLRVSTAPESGWIDPAALLGQSWTIGRRANRVGIELEGAPIQLKMNEPLDSSAVFPGTIQCPPSGLPFLLGADAQTTGGYPRIAQVIRADRHVIGQIRPGATLRFQRVEPAEARRLYQSKIALIRQLQPDFRLD